MRLLPLSFAFFILSIFFLLVGQGILFIGFLIFSSMLLGHMRMVHLMDNQPNRKDIKKDNIKLSVLGVSCFIVSYFVPLIFDLLFSFSGGVCFGLIGVNYFFEKGSDN